jgi:hypothetical protein
LTGSRRIGRRNARDTGLAEFVAVAAAEGDARMGEFDVAGSDCWPGLATGYVFCWTVMLDCQAGVAA